jgi:hypothetical protein
MSRTNFNSDNRAPSCEGCQPDKHASNSFRRIGTDRGDGNVLCAVKQPADGHPDLHAGTDVLDYIVAAHPFTILQLIRERDAARHALHFVRCKISGHDGIFQEAGAMCPEVLNPGRLGDQDFIDFARKLRSEMIDLDGAQWQTAEDLRQDCYLARVQNDQAARLRVTNAINACQAAHHQQADADADESLSHEQREVPRKGALDRDRTATEDLAFAEDTTMAQVAITVAGLLASSGMTSRDLAKNARVPENHILAIIGGTKDAQSIRAISRIASALGRRLVLEFAQRDHTVPRDESADAARAAVEQIAARAAVEQIAAYISNMNYVALAHVSPSELADEIRAGHWKPVQPR